MRPDPRDSHRGPGRSSLHSEAGYISADCAHHQNGCPCAAGADHTFFTISWAARNLDLHSTEFKRTTVQRILTGEKTLAELSPELDISPSVIRNWKRFAEAGATTAVQASEDVVPTSQLREAYAKIRELERALGRKTKNSSARECWCERRRCRLGRSKRHEP
jgi:transposase-like protein